ncbi:MAG: hypothetical protein KAS77_09165, partial [Thermoplasmata archaeon]|nr:hypothetical protein [Thermoplasmata archaeon]
IVCDSDNETVRSLSFLDEDNHFSGSFKLKEGSPKKIKFFDEDRPLYEARDRQWVVYCGEMPRSGTRGEDVFLIELDVKDGSIVS